MLDEGLLITMGIFRNYLTQVTVSDSKNINESTSSLAQALEKALRAYRARKYAFAIGLEPKSDAELRLRRLEVLYPKASLDRSLKIKRA